MRSLLSLKLAHRWLCLPKINDYGSPQLSTNSGKVQNSTDLFLTGDQGRALQKVGGVIGDFGEALQKRKIQSEISDSEAAFAQGTTDNLAYVDDQIQKGEIDAGKIDEHLNDYISKMPQMETYSGREYSDRQAAYLKKRVMSAAIRGQAVVAGAKAKDNILKANQFRSSSLFSHPGAFIDDLQSAKDGIDEQVKLGLPKIEGDKLKRQAGNELAKAEIQGFAQFSPSLAKDALNSGRYDAHIDGADKATLTSYIKAMESAQETNLRRMELLEKRRLKIANEAWLQGNMPAMAAGTLDPKSFFDPNATFVETADRFQWYNKYKEYIKDRTGPNPAVENEVVRRILLPDGDTEKIYDMNGMRGFINKGLTFEKAVQLSGWVDNTPEGKIAADNRKGLFELAKSKLAKTSMMNPIPDPIGQMKLNQFMTALALEEQRYISEKKNPSDLTNPNSKDYFGNQMGKYARTQKEIMQDLVKEMKKK